MNHGGLQQRLNFTESETRTINVVQLKMKALLSTMFGLMTKHAVSQNISYI